LNLRAVLHLAHVIVPLQRQAEALNVRFARDPSSPASGNSVVYGSDEDRFDNSDAAEVSLALFVRMPDTAGTDCGPLFNAIHGAADSSV